MATTISRAGKQVFANIVSPGNPNTNQNGNTASSTPFSPNGHAAMSSPPLTNGSKTMLSSTLPNSNQQSLTEQLSSFRNLRESISLSKLENYSNDDNYDDDLEQTLQECLTLDTSTGRNNAFSPLPSNYKPTDSLNNGFTSIRTPKLSDPGYSQISHSFTPLSSSSSSSKKQSKDDLLAELQALKRQNEQLTAQMEYNRLEQEKNLELEKHSKLLLVQSLEFENQRLLQQLIEEKMKSETTLEKEKQEFIKSIKEMEEEKESLEIKMYSLEEERKTEIGFFIMEKAEFDRQLAEIEKKQTLTLQQLQETIPIPEEDNNTNIKDDAKSSKYQNAIDINNTLQSQLHKMEEEKQALLESIKQNTIKQENENTKLSSEILLLQQEMHEKLFLMEKDKIALTEKLKTAENQVNNANNLISNQIEKQKQQTIEMCDVLEKEKQELLQQKKQAAGLSEEGEEALVHDNNLFTSALVEDEKEEIKNSAVLEKEKSSKGSSKKKTSSGAVIDKLLQEKTMLQEKLKQSAESSKQKVNKLTEVIQQRKKKLLMKNMNKIKEHYSNEKLKEMKDINTEIGTTPASATSPVPFQTAPSSSSSSGVQRDSIPAGSDEIKSPPPQSPLSVNNNHSNSQSSVGKSPAVNGDQISPNITPSKSLLTPTGKFMSSTRSLFDLMTEINHQNKSPLVTATQATSKTPSSGSLSLSSAMGGERSSSHNLTSSLFSNPFEDSNDDSDYYEIIGNYHHPQRRNSCSNSRSGSSHNLKGLTIAGGGGGGKILTHAISRIDEKTFMDDDSDDESTEKDKQKSKRESPLKTLSRKGDNTSSPIVLEREKSLKSVKGEGIAFSGNMDLFSLQSNDQQEQKQQKEQQQQQQQQLQQLQQQFQLQQQQIIEDQPFSDLPAPHAAAASGDLTRFQSLYAIDPALIESLDSVGRQPLFYAVAHSRDNIVDYLLAFDERLPSSLINPRLSNQRNQLMIIMMLLHADSFGDTPLHAASAGGSVNCIEKLLIFHSKKYEEVSHLYSLIQHELEEDEEEHHNNHYKITFPSSSSDEFSLSDYYVNIKNSTGMTPIHLAGNGLCIEKLIEFNGNINLTDIHLRTPLFISCAINKESCVEYLIGYLDSSEEALLQKDYRGDTPLHASACNGSVESLLLLLQCGIDPRICNDQGLKAIDLAIRNKHYKCKEILAEYHLHYCTSSEFDSVLFLATLEVIQKLFFLCSLR
jgi:ankyrin repeat protein